MSDDEHTTPNGDDGLSPSEALELYLDTRRGEVTDSTLNSHRYRLEPLVEWCADNDVTNTDQLDGTTLHKYRLWRQEDGDLNTVSLHTQLSTVRVFLKFLESIDAVEQGLYDKLMIPALNDGEDQRESTLDPDHAERALEYLRNFEYASADHVLLLLLWRTGMRVGAAQSLDVDDYSREKARLRLAHRPQGGTTLKMGNDGQRYVALSSRTCVVLNDYLDNVRSPVTDDHGRKPLLVFGQTRPNTSTLREHVHRCTQPCVWLSECPHDRTIDSCDATGYGFPTDCPSSTPPHDVRRGAITHMLSEDVPEQVVSDRANVNEEVLGKHYDVRTEESKAEQRRKFLDEF